MPRLLVEGQVQDGALYWSWELSRPLGVSLWCSGPGQGLPLHKTNPWGPRRSPGQSRGVVWGPGW